MLSGLHPKSRCGTSRKQRLAVLRVLSWSRAYLSQSSIMELVILHAINTTYFCPVKTLPTIWQNYKHHLKLLVLMYFFDEEDKGGCGGFMLLQVLLAKEEVVTWKRIKRCQILTLWVWHIESLLECYLWDEPFKTFVWKRSLSFDCDCLHVNALKMPSWRLVI